MRTTGELIYHFRNHDGDELVARGGATAVVSMELVQTPSYKNGLILLNFATAYCSMHYNFCKKTGRELAKKRFANRDETYFNTMILGPVEDFNVVLVEPDRFYLPQHNNPIYEVLRNIVIDHFKNVVAPTLDYDASTGLEQYDFDADTEDEDDDTFFTS
jgi:hypothetical protein